MPSQTYRVLDMHTAGEPVRIVTEGYPALRGGTILEKRRAAREDYDHIRRILMLEPRGHSGMYGVIPVEPSAPGADMAVLFTHNEGYSTMCGHATIAVGRWAVESGRVKMTGDHTRFRLEVPCGVLDVDVTAQEGRVLESSFLSVPAFASHFDAHAFVAPYGDLNFDIAYGGAFYVILPSSQLGLPFWSTPLENLVDAGVRITDGVRRQVPLTHPDAADLGFLYGTILTDDAAAAQLEPTYNLCIFAEGQIDRSPTGSGATARMALDYARGRIPSGRARLFHGVSGVPFRAHVEEASGDGLAARVRVLVAGASHVMGEATLILEAGDPLPNGFQMPARFADLRSAGN